MSLQLLENKALSRDIIRKSAPLLAEITIRKSQVCTGTIKNTDFLPGAAYVLADGSSINSARFLLRSLKIGQRRVPEVAASVGPVASSLLLGQSFLEKLGAWGIDNQRHVLTLGMQGERK